MPQNGWVVIECLLVEATAHELWTIALSDTIGSQGVVEERGTDFSLTDRSAGLIAWMLHAMHVACTSMMFGHIRMSIACSH